MKSKKEKRRCYRCGATKAVKTYGKMDWCLSCKGDMEALGVKVPDPS